MARAAEQDRFAIDNLALTNASHSENRASRASVPDRGPGPAGIECHCGPSSFLSLNI